MEHDELIYKKLSNELTSDEELIFEHRLAVDQAFAEEYAFQQSAVEALTKSEEVAMKKKLQRAYQAVRERKRRRRRRGWAVAAVGMLLLVAGAMLWYQRYEAVPLYEQYFTLYQPYPEVRGAAEADTYAQAMQRYQQGDYAEAITLFNKLPSSDRRNLYLGNCHWQLGDVAEAQRYFEAVQASNNSIMRQHTEWYLVLCYLRQGNTAQAQSQLQTILAEEGLYYKEAQQLLAEL